MSECKHGVGKLVDRYDKSQGARCVYCGEILPVDGVPLRRHLPDPPPMTGIIKTERGATRSRTALELARSVQDTNSWDDVSPSDTRELARALIASDQLVESCHIVLTNLLRAIEDPAADDIKTDVVLAMSPARAVINLIESEQR